jgi:hypothetical protein
MRITNRFFRKIGIRLHDENRSLVFPERFSIEIMIMIAFSKPETDCEMIVKPGLAAMPVIIFYPVFSRA